MLFTIRSPLGRQLLGAVGGSLIALALYQTYSFSAPRFQAMLVTFSSVDTPIDVPVVQDDGSDALADAFAKNVLVSSEPEKVAALSTVVDVSLPPHIESPSPLSDQRQSSVTALPVSGTKELFLIPLAAFLALAEYHRRKSRAA